MSRREVGECVPLRRHQSTVRCRRPQCPISHTHFVHVTFAIRMKECTSEAQEHGEKEVGDLVLINEAAVGELSLRVFIETLHVAVRWGRCCGPTSLVVSPKWCPMLCCCRECVVWGICEGSTRS